ATTPIAASRPTQSTCVSSISVIPHPPRPTLFPYTTLFRSRRIAAARSIARVSAPCACHGSVSAGGGSGSPASVNTRSSGKSRNRSEEHTSELQSRGHLVCRLLLEKKNPRRPAHLRGLAAGP